jgi:hypothetical protein
VMERIRDCHDVHAAIWAEVKRVARSRPPPD